MSEINLNSTTGNVIAIASSLSYVSESNGFPVDFIGSHACVLSIITVNNGQKYGFQIILSRKKIAKARMFYVGAEEWFSL